MYLEFPKHVYKGPVEDGVSKLVANAEEEAAAEAQGYAALPSAPPVEPAAPGGPEHLEFPKVVYRGEDDARESITVKNADEEAAAAEQGYAALHAKPSDDEAGKAHKKGRKGAKA